MHGPPPPIRKAPPSHPKKPAMTAIFHGVPGVGKTSFAANFEQPTGFIVDHFEQGITYLSTLGLVPEPQFIHILSANPKGADELMAHVNMSIGSGIKTLVLESLTGIQNLLFAAEAKENFEDDLSPEGGFFAFQRGPRQVSTFRIQKLLNLLQHAVDSGINVIINAHSSDKQQVTSTGVQYTRAVVQCDKDLWTNVAKWASVIGYFEMNVQTDSEASRGKLKKIAKTPVNRRLRVNTVAYAEAKNWWGINEVINCGDSGEEAAANFRKAFRLGDQT